MTSSADSSQSTEFVEEVKQMRFFIVLLATMLAGSVADAQSRGIPTELPADPTGIAGMCQSIQPDSTPLPRHHRERALIEVAEARGVVASSQSNWQAASAALWGAFSHHGIISRAIEVLSPLSNMEGRGGARSCALITCLLSRTDLTSDQRSSLEQRDRELVCHPVVVIPVVVPPPTLPPSAPSVIPLTEEERLAVLADESLAGAIRRDEDFIIGTEGDWHVNARFRSSIAQALTRYRARRTTPIVTPHPRVVPIVPRRSTMGYVFPIATGVLAAGGWTTFAVMALRCSDLNAELDRTQSGQTIGVRQGLESDATNSCLMANIGLGAGIGFTAFSVATALIFAPSSPVVRHHVAFVPSFGTHGATGLSVGGTF